MEKAAPEVVGNDAIVVNNDIKEYNDVEKDDPNLVEGILTAELMKLSVQNRTEFQEEVHGVRCLAPRETPELLARSLSSLQLEIDTAIPAREKHGYLQSQLLPETYVNTDDFRLRFLRCELFDVPKAAVRMVRFLELARELYGDFSLERPIRLSDFSRSELKYLRKGHYQVLPYRDRGGVVGRRVIAVFPDLEWEDYPPYLRNKILMYYSWSLGDDVEAQREGIIFVVWFDATAQVTRKPAIHIKDHETVAIRPTGIHCCSPDTPLYRFRRSILTMRIGKFNRTRLVMHLGNSMENRYKLQSYGIPPDQMPITYAGRIKTVYLRQWMKLREHIELGVNEPRSSSKGSTMGGRFGFLGDGARIESPFLSDVIFRKGTSLASHPGNTKLRSMILAKAKKDLLESKQQQLRGFVSDVIRELRETSRAEEAAGTGRACRFLVWDEGGWWTELFQEHDIHARIDIIARGIRTTVGKNLVRASGTAAAAAAAATKTAKRTKTAAEAYRSPQPQGPANTDNIFGSGTSSTASMSSSLTSSLSSLSSSVLGDVSHRRQRDSQFTALVPGTENENAAFRNPPIQHQHGGTDLFRSLDHSFPVDTFQRDVKKRRTLLTTQGTTNDDAFAASLSGRKNDAYNLTDENHSTVYETHCFGMKFNATSS